MTKRTLDNPPSILPLYARAAAPMIPGASLLPFVPGGGKNVPDLELTLEGVRPDPETVATYAKVCGFALRDPLPPTYPHVLAFPLPLRRRRPGPCREPDRSAPASRPWRGTAARRTPNAPAAAQARPNLQPPH